RIPLDAAEVLERAADAEGNVDLWLDRLPRGADLARAVEPLRVDDRAGAAQRGAHGFAELLDQGDVLLLSDPAADRHEHVLAGDVDVARLRLDQLHERAAGGEAGGVGGAVDDVAGHAGFPRAEGAGANRD